MPIWLQRQIGVSACIHWKMYMRSRTDAAGTWKSMLVVCAPKATRRRVLVFGVPAVWYWSRSFPSRCSKPWVPPSGFFHLTLDPSSKPTYWLPSNASPSSWLHRIRSLPTLLQTPLSRLPNFLLPSHCLWPIWDGNQSNDPHSVDDVVVKEAKMTNDRVL